MSFLQLSPLPTIGELLKLYRVRALKKLSQNFLLDLRITNKIVKAAGNLNDGEVCEVGPGPGGLTRSILNSNPAKVIVIEKDKRFKPMLEALSESSYTRFDIIFGDIMLYDMCKTFNASLSKQWNEEPPNIHVIGNLPFSVSTPLIIRWLKDISLKRNAWTYGRVKMTLTFQEEVAIRIVAPPGSKFRCRMSVMCQNWCSVHHKFTIPGAAFLPKPEVNVGVVRLDPLVKPIISLKFELIEKVLRVMFNFRKKYCLHSAKNLFPKELTEKLTEELFSRAQLNPTVRPYQLSNEEWGRICFAYKAICDRDSRVYSYDHRGRISNREEIWKKSLETPENSDEIATL